MIDAAKMFHSLRFYCPVLPSFTRLKASVGEGTKCSTEEEPIHWTWLNLVKSHLLYFVKGLHSKAVCLIYRELLCYSRARCCWHKLATFWKERKSLEATYLPGRIFTLTELSAFLGIPKQLSYQETSKNRANFSPPLCFWKVDQYDGCWVWSTCFYAFVTKVWSRPKRGPCWLHSGYFLKHRVCVKHPAHNQTQTEAATVSMHK